MFWKKRQEEPDEEEPVEVEKRKLELKDLIKPKENPIEIQRLKQAIKNTAIAAENQRIKEAQENNFIRNQETVHVPNNGMNMAPMVYAQPMNMEPQQPQFIEPTRNERLEQMRSKAFGDFGTTNNQELGNRFDIKNKSINNKIW